MLDEYKEVLRKRMLTASLTTPEVLEFMKKYDEPQEISNLINLLTDVKAESFVTKGDDGEPVMFWRIQLTPKQAHLDKVTVLRNELTEMLRAAGPEGVLLDEVKEVFARHGITNTQTITNHRKKIGAISRQELRAQLPGEPRLPWRWYLPELMS